MLLLLLVLLLVLGVEASEADVSEEATAEEAAEISCEAGDEIAAMDAVARCAA
jgi:hypothetical protein